MMTKKRQEVLIFQQGKRALSKFEWIKKHASKEIAVTLITLKSNLPIIIESPHEYLPQKIQADLVLDYLEHQDLSYFLSEMCIKNNIPVISPGKKSILGKKHYVPVVCCALKQASEIGNYGKYFGKPKLEIVVTNNKISKITVLRGSPCGSTWKAAKKIIGIPIEKAGVQFGLTTQHFCTANSNNWNPIINKNPIHIAAELHKNAFIAAIKQSLSTS